MSDVEMQVRTLNPEKGDLLVLQTPQILSADQRQIVKDLVERIAAQFGCKSVVLDGGFDLLLLKTPAAE